MWVGLKAATVPCADDGNIEGHFAAWSELILDGPLTSRVVNYRLYPAVYVPLPVRGTRIEGTYYVADIRQLMHDGLRQIIVHRTRGSERCEQRASAARLWDVTQGYA